MLKYGIKTRHRIMIGIALFSLILMGFTAFYFYQTSRVLTTIINAERVHNVNYYTGVKQFYQYLENKDSSLIVDGLKRLDSANTLALYFGESREIISKEGKKVFAEKMYRAAPEAFAYNPSSADLMANRVQLLLKLNIKHVHKNIDIAYQGSQKGKVIKETIVSYLHNPSVKNLKEIEEANLIMEQFFIDFAKSINNLNVFAKNFLITDIVIIVLLLGLLTLFLTIIISNTITKPIIKLVDNVNEFSKGDLNQKIQIDSHDEIGKLGISFNQMIENLEQITEQANIISQGDYSRDLQPRSEKDVLGKSIQEMTVSLRNISNENEKENWLKTGINKLNDEMRGDQDLKTLCRRIITYIAKYVDAKMGVFYLMDKEDEVLNLTASYAFSNRKSLSNSFKIGEGLVGQAALEQEIITIEEMPEEYFKVSSGLGNAYPKNVMVIPIVFDSQIVAVIELGSLQAFNQNQTEFLKSITENIGISINTSYARTEMQKLLIKTQEQSEELMTQQEELRQSNEELEEQTKALKDSEQQLQQQQEELRVTNEELKERTLALEKQRDDIRIKNSELEKAQQEVEMKARDLELASRYKSEFLANMSHELRTPLNSILVLSQILSKNKLGNLNEKQIQSAQTIYSSGNSLLSLINEVLDLSKVESGKLELNYEDVYISNFVNEVEDTFKPLASDKGLDFIISVDEQIPKSIETDGLRLHQIIRNLISNAMKFTNQGSVTLDISYPDKRLDLYDDNLSKKNMIAFSVIDTGIGIPKDKQDLIFEAFKQADGTTTRKYGGTGLGLTISKNFAHLLGGEIHLHSEENKGTTFTLLIPLNKEDSQTEEKIIVAEPEKKTEHQERKEVAKPLPKPSPKSIENVKDDRKSISKGDKFILIIEDDPDFSQILYDLAHEKGFKCMIAPNGETGLHYADYYKPDAIILDIGLPGIDGWEVIDRLKENPETRHIPVHFMSGKDKSLEAMKRGAIGFLKKPIGLDDINKAFSDIENVISKPLKKVIVVEDDKIMRSSIEELIGAKDVITTSVDSGKNAIELLKEESFDCMILDLGLKDMSGEELLKKLGKDKKYANMPVIIYTGKDLTREEEENLRKYSDRIIIKGVRSPERLLSETTLFLHKVESELPADKQKMLKDIHKHEDVMKDKKILIVDDDMRNVFALTSLLEERGVKIEVGRNGREGIEKLEAKPDIDLVIMDIMMPEMNGYEAMEAIRKNQKFRKIPIIALTAKAMQGDKEKCIQAGANDYLTKPIDSDKLISLLRVWLYQ
jgi:CheY-like chemotaxis protein/signal transduction histidine kinase/HAMP domain-containing protein